jgi:hypothetical protein
MIGNKRKGMVLQTRDRHLLEELAVMRVIDCELARRVGPFGSVTRANYRLLLLTLAGLLHRFYIGTKAGGKKALYMLSPSGAKLIGASATGLRRKRDEIVATDLFVAHQSGINRLYCDFKYGPATPGGVLFNRWVTFTAPLDRTVPLIPDGYVECGGADDLSAFIEVDLAHERLSVWQVKVRNYLHFAASGSFRDQFGRNRFVVLVVCESHGRMESLRGAIAKLTEKIFRFTTFDLIGEHGLWSAIWRKPAGKELHALVERP